MDIHLCLKPSGLHFDPERIDLEICGQYGIDHITITHPGNPKKHYQIPAGNIHIEDRVNKTLEIFTFGGFVDIESMNDCTLCSFYSDAPILVGYQEETPATIFIDEAEILIAERRAAAGTNIEKYGEALCQVDPLTLYYTCLKTVKERLTHITRNHDEPTTRLIHIIKDEMGYLEEESVKRPDIHRKFEDLL